MTPYRRLGSATQHWIGSGQHSGVARQSRGEDKEAEVELTVGVSGIPLRLHLANVEVCAACKGVSDVCGAGVSF
jgi:hypothetical protein